MRTLRTLLILLLCLTVPVAGWASVASTRLCASSSGQRVSHGATVHQHASATYGHAQAVHAHPASTKGSPCQGKPCHHSCGCGCGVGACSSSFASLPPAQLPWLSFSGAGLIASAHDQPFAIARGTSPLRPPIA